MDDDPVGRVLKRSGGSNQRLLASNDKPVESTLAQRLEEAWGWGLLSAPLLQWFAEGAHNDGVQNIANLGSIGSWGQHEGNCHRDLTRRLLKRLDLPSPTLVDCPLQVSKEKSTMDGQWPVLMPSHLFQCIAASYPESFDDMMENAVEFWRSIPEGDPKCYNHPFLKWPGGWEANTMPISLHGDAGTFTRGGESIVVLSWSSILQRAGTWDTIFLIAAIPKGAIVKETDGQAGTLEVLCSAIAHDIKSMLYMVHPPLNHVGSEWADGSEAHGLAGKKFAVQKRAVLWLLVGDLEWFSNYLHVDTHFGSNTPCWLCSCNTSTHPWTDFGDAAKWRETILDRKAGQAKISKNKIFSIPGVSRFNLCIDTMHTVCLGVSACALGSALRDLVCSRQFYAGRNQNLRLKLVWEEIREIYQELQTPHRLNNLRLTMFLKKQHFAELSCSAAECRCLVPVMAQLLLRRGAATVLNAHRAQVFVCLRSFYEIIECSGFQLSPDDLVRLRSEVDMCLKHYKALSVHCIESGILAWPLRPKLHFYWHIGQAAGFLNPRLGWTYQFENFVQKILRVVKACAKGTPPHRIGPSVMSKYRTVLNMRLQRRCR